MATSGSSANAWIAATPEPYFSTRSYAPEPSNNPQQLVDAAVCGVSQSNGVSTLEEEAILIVQDLWEGLAAAISSEQAHVHELVMRQRESAQHRRELHPRNLLGLQQP